jgi:hypothetical protein
LADRAQKGGSDPAFFLPSQKTAPGGDPWLRLVKAKKRFEISLMLA